MGYEEGKRAVFDRNINGWLLVPEDMEIVVSILWTLFDKKVPSPHIGIFNHQTKETHTRGKRHHGLGKKDTQ